MTPTLLMTAFKQKHMKTQKYDIFHPLYREATFLPYAIGIVVVLVALVITLNHFI